MCIRDRHIGVAVLGHGGEVNRLPVDAERCVLAPRRDADRERRLRRAGNRVHRRAAMREIGLAGEGDALLRLDRAADEQIDKERFVVLAVGVFTEGGDDARDIRRAAGTGVPLRAHGQVLPVRDRDAGNARNRLERVDVEEAFAVELHAGEHRVVELSLIHIFSAGGYFFPFTLYVISGKLIVTKIS